MMVLSKSCHRITNIWLVSILVFVGFFPVVAISEVYVWTDERGRKHFSDKRVAVSSSEVVQSRGQTRLFSTRSQENIWRGFDSAKQRIYQLYYDELSRSPEIRGNLSFKLVILPDGSVRSCDIRKSELHRPQLESKIVQQVLNIDFGAGDVKDTRVLYSFDFKPKT